jgi:TctA family transporter
MPAPARRRRAPLFQPRFTLGLLYLIAFFSLYCFLLAARPLYEVLSTTAPGPEQQAQAEQVMREALRGRLWVALVAALATTGGLGWLGRLPGAGRRR